MSSLLARRITVLLKPNSPISHLCSKASTFLEKELKPTRTILPSLLEPSTIPSDIKIDLIDSDAWQVSSGLSESWRKTKTPTSEPSEPSTTGTFSDKNQSCFSSNEPDFDEIEDMRLRGNLFYKLDRDSREFEENNFDFHRSKSSKKNQENNKTEKAKKTEKEKEKEKEKGNSSSERLRREKIVKNEGEMVGEKKERSLTFNQLTAAYHEPFCLDIYISKSSVRACIVHRVTSKVVAVAHSISKDMKFDLVSTRDYAACEAVGGVLAQRALADDIHDVIYTPRKGEKVEGKLQSVLQAVIDNGINVKLKLKQRKAKKVGFSYKKQGDYFDAELRDIIGISQDHLVVIEDSDG